MRRIVLSMLGLSAALSCGSAAMENSAQRFYPQQLNQDGRVTLTPSFSPDGNTIYFAQSECTPIWKCPQTLKKSVRTAQGWSAPQSVDLGREGRVDWPSVSPDGQILIFSWSADRPELAGRDIYENFDLYTLDLTDPDASPDVIRSGGVNRIREGEVKTLRYVHNEGFPSLTKNGTLYYMTERLDGVGERDIYRARPDGDGGYMTAQPVAAPINTAGRDDGVWVNYDETLMLLTYNERGGEGQSDLFISFNDSGAWTQPVNLGPHINSAYGDFGARLSPDGKTILFSSTRPVAGQPEELIQVWSAPFDAEIYR